MDPFRLGALVELSLQSADNGGSDNAPDSPVLSSEE
jgi:hypothetical protein